MNRDKVKLYMASLMLILLVGFLIIWRMTI